MRVVSFYGFPFCLEISASVCTSELEEGQEVAASTDTKIWCVVIVVIALTGKAVTFRCLGVLAIVGSQPTKS